MTAIPSGKPTASAVSDFFARSRCLWTIATQTAASGPNSGPTTIAPTIRIGESVMTPTPPISIAITMNARNENDSSVSSDVRLSTCSQTTASEGAPGAAFSAASKASEIAVSTYSSEIVPR